jgi:hypothetical protein
MSMSGPVWGGESITNAILSPITSTSDPSKKITKIVFNYNADQSLNNVQYYAGSTLVCTLTFAYSAGTGLVLSITRS